MPLVKPVGVELFRAGLRVSALGPRPSFDPTIAPQHRQAKPERAVFWSVPADLEFGYVPRVEQRRIPRPLAFLGPGDVDERIVRRAER